jgi:hypothetical protein
MIEVSFRSFGPLQLDGLYRRERLDLVLRSHAPLAAEIRSEATKRFAGTLSATGLAGALAFSVVPRFAVSAAPQPKAVGIDV